MNNKTRVLMVEAPDNCAEVDFLSEKVSVKLTVENGAVLISVKKFGDDPYTWKEEFVRVSL
jgi:hypothetical protein